MEPQHLTVINPETIQAAEKAEAKPKRDHNGPYTSKSTGVVLEYQKVPSQILYKAWGSLTPPSVPEFWNEDAGRMEPNPIAPSYQTALAVYQHQRTNLTTMIYFMIGVKVKHVPEDMYKIESDDWYSGLEDFLNVPPKGNPRKAAWLMYYALPDDEEQAEVLTDLMIISGMTLEREVAEDVESFPDNAGEASDNKTQSTQGN